MLNRPLLVLLKEVRNQLFFFIVAILVYPIALLSKLLFAKQQIWIIGENEGTYLGDNSYFFFLYCCNQPIGRNCYFIANRKSLKNYPHLQDTPNVIIFSSFKHVFLFLLADVIIFSHSYSDIAYNNIVRLFNPRCKKVFLQHGIIAFKKIHSVYRKNHNEMDLFIVSSHFEKSLVEKNFDFPSERIKIAGLARYDMLATQPCRSQRDILFFPTWRNWSFPKDVVLNYHFTIKSLLNNINLIDMLDRHNARLTFFSHSSAQNIVSDIPQDLNIKAFCAEEVNLQELIANSSLLITDYSSVAWDFLYQNKPVIFYQFDQADYLRYKGAYIDFDHDLFGDICKCEDDLLVKIEQSFINNFSLRQDFKIFRKKSFEYFDRNNCARIYDSIIALLT